MELDRPLQSDMLEEDMPAKNFNSSNNLNLLQTELYPGIKIDHIKNPNRWYAFPVLGLIVKIIMLIPIGIMAVAAMFAAFILNLINPFVVLFTGHYWDYAYQTARAAFIVNAKLIFFLAGLTDRYPGFNFETNDIFGFSLPEPKAPSKLLAIPALGILIRIILLIPFYIFSGIVQYASYLGIFFSAFPVIFQGKYPESTYEINLDNTRINLAQYTYMFGLSDHYPSFSISMKHKNIKIALLIAGAILWLLNTYYSHASQQNSYYDNSGYGTSINSTY